MVVENNKHIDCHRAPVFARYFGGVTRGILLWFEECRGGVSVVGRGFARSLLPATYTEGLPEIILRLQEYRGDK